MGNKDGKPEKGGASGSDGKPAGQAKPQNSAVPPSVNPTAAKPEAATETPTETPKASDAPPAKVTRGDFDLMGEIGRGSFGTVYLVKKIDDEHIYAMKKIDKKSFNTPKEIEQAMAERNVWAGVDSPFISKLHYSFQDTRYLYFVMDYINGGELFEHLCKASVFPEERARFYAASLVLALECLHGLGIVYRDLKPENVLLKADGNIVLVDFGQAKAVGAAEDARTTTLCGTPAYYAPEIIEGKPYTKNVDFWSLGTMIYEMLWGVGPFWHDDQPTFFQNLLEMELIMDESWSPEVCDLMSKLLERDGNKRLSSTTEMKAHPWFASIDWAKLAKQEFPTPFKPEIGDPLEGKEKPTDEGDAGGAPADASFGGFTFVSPVKTQ